jgi:predicted CopG family antitoxin
MEKNKKDRTTISISKEMKEELSEMGTKQDSYEDIIRKLLDDKQSLKGGSNRICIKK